MGEPDARLAQKGFEDYMLEGPLAALDAVEKAPARTSERHRLLPRRDAARRDARLPRAEKANRVASATFFVSLLDFSQPGELGVFIDEEQVANLERKMNERGYLEGSEMAGTFNLLRANDLVWSFVVNNYLLGKDPFPFDLLYWNADSTRMPARMHSFYLRNMYIKNLLGEPGGIELAGVPIELGEVKVPSYFISTVEDHIAPWKTTYKARATSAARCASFSAAPATSPASSTRHRRTSITTGRTTPCRIADAWLQRRPSIRARGGKTGSAGSNRFSGGLAPAAPAKARCALSRTPRLLRQDAHRR